MGAFGLVYGGFRGRQGGGVSWGGNCEAASVVAGRYTALVKTRPACLQSEPILVSKRSVKLVAVTGSWGGLGLAYRGAGFLGSVGARFAGGNGHESPPRFLRMAIPETGVLIDQNVVATRAMEALTKGRV